MYEELKARPVYIVSRSERGAEKRTSRSSCPTGPSPEPRVPVWTLTTAASIANCTSVTGGGGRGKPHCSKRSTGFGRRPGGRSILDIGCGDGLFFDRLLKFGEVEGVEPVGELVNPTGATANRIHVGRFDDRFQPVVNCFELILMLDVLEHLDNPVGAVRRGVSCSRRAG